MYQKNERTVLSEHEKLVKLQHEFDNVKAEFGRTHTKLVQSLEQQFSKRWFEEMTKHQNELK
jgi:hypothetical protein